MGTLSDIRILRRVGSGEFPGADNHFENALLLPHGMNGICAKDHQHLVNPGGIRRNSALRGVETPAHLNG